MNGTNGEPSTDGMIAKALIAEQPRSIESLHIATGRSKETVANRLKVLDEMNLTKKTIGGWAFSNYNPLRKTVREAMEHLKVKGSYHQWPAIIASTVNQLNPDLAGAIPEKVEPIAWRLSSKLKVTMEANEVFRETMIKRSQRSIPVLIQIARIIMPVYAVKEGDYINVQNMKLRIDRVMNDHLRYYPVSEFIDKREEIEKRIELIREDLRFDLMEKLKNKFKDELIVEPDEEKNNKSFLRTAFPAQISNYILSGDPIQIMVNGEKIWFGDTCIATGSHLENRIKEFVNHEIEDPRNIEIKKMRDSLQESAKPNQLEIEREIREIIEDIESDIPLRGRYTR